MLRAPDDWGMCTAQMHTQSQTHTAMRGPRAAHAPKHTTSSFWDLVYLAPQVLSIIPSFLFLSSSLFLYLCAFSHSLAFCNRSKRLREVLLVWVEKGGLTPRKEEGRGDVWRQKSRPQLMENRCGGEKERKREKDEERREEEKKRWMLLPVRLKSKIVYVRFGCLCVMCVVYTVFKTYCVRVSSCRDSDWVGGCRSLSSRVVPSVLESDSGHLLF